MIEKSRECCHKENESFHASRFAREQGEDGGNASCESENSEEGHDEALYVSQIAIIHGL